MDATLRKLLEQAGVTPNDEEIEKIEPLFRLYMDGLRTLRAIELREPEAALTFAPLPESQ